MLAPCICVFGRGAKMAQAVFVFFKADDAARLTPCKEDNTEKPKRAATDCVPQSKTHMPYLPGPRGPSQKKKKAPNLSVKCFSCVGAYLSSRAATSQVLSAQVSLTAVFGMGTGVPSPPSAPTMFQDHTLKTE